MKTKQPDLQQLLVLSNILISFSCKLYRNRVCAIRALSPCNKWNNPPIVYIIIHGCGQRDVRLDTMTKPAWLPVGSHSRSRSLKRQESICESVG